MSKSQKSRYITQLEDRIGWRIAKVIYFLICLLLLGNLLLSEEIDDNERLGYIFVVLLLFLGIFRLFRRIAIYILYGRITKKHRVYEE